MMLKRIINWPHTEANQLAPVWLILLRLPGLSVCILGKYLYILGLLLMFESDLAYYEYENMIVRLW